MLLLGELGVLAVEFTEDAPEGLYLLDVLEVLAGDGARILSAAILDGHKGLVEEGLRGLVVLLLGDAVRELSLTARQHQHVCGLAHDLGLLEAL